MAPKSTTLAGSWVKKLALAHDHARSALIRTPPKTAFSGGSPLTLSIVPQPLSAQAAAATRSAHLVMPTPPREGTTIQRHQSWSRPSFSCEMRLEENKLK